MKPFSIFWRKVCEPLDGFLWQRNISHRLIRPMLRNQILVTGASILAGGVCYFAFSQIFWAGVGLGIITWIFWSWARFFSQINLAEYNAALLRIVLFRFGGRLALLAFLLYVALAVFKAAAGAIIVGMVGGAVIAIGSCAHYLIAARRRTP